MGSWHRAEGAALEARLERLGKDVALTRIEAQVARASVASPRHSGMEQAHAKKNTQVSGERGREVREAEEMAAWQTGDKEGTDGATAAELQYAAGRSRADRTLARSSSTTGLRARVLARRMGSDVSPAQSGQYRSLRPPRAEAGDGRRARSFPVM